MSTFVANSPSGTDIPPDTTPQTRTNWTAIRDWMAVDHEAFTAGASAGAHKPGIDGVLFYGTTAQIEALSSPGSGAIAYDIEAGCIKNYVPTVGWKRLTYSDYSRLKKVLVVSTSIPTNEWTQVSMGSVSGQRTYDGLSEWLTHTATIKDAGYYLISSSIIWERIANETFLKKAAIYKNGSPVSIDVMYGAENSTNRVTDLLYLGTNDTISIYVYHNRGDTTTIRATLHYSRM